MSLETQTASCVRDDRAVMGGRVTPATTTPNAFNRAADPSRWSPSSPLTSPRGGTSDRRLARRCRRAGLTGTLDIHRIVHGPRRTRPCSSLPDGDDAARRRRRGRPTACPRPIRIPMRRDHPVSGSRATSNAICPTRASGLDYALLTHFHRRPLRPGLGDARRRARTARTSCQASRRSATRFAFTR